MQNTERKYWKKIDRGKKVYSVLSEKSTNWVREENGAQLVGTDSKREETDGHVHFSGFSPIFSQMTHHCKIRIVKHATVSISFVI
jgi:hypothetical protein